MVRNNVFGCYIYFSDPHKNRQIGSSDTHYNSRDLIFIIKNASFQFFGREKLF